MFLINCKFKILIGITSVFFIGCKKVVDTPKDISQYPQVMCAPIITDKDWYIKDNKAPLFEGLEALSFPITTENKLAQKYFNQGLILAYAFNHAEAARSFYYASKLDSTCAMSYWGFAYVLGPNYNAGMEEDNYQRAYDAIQKAILLSEKCSAKEKALISAMSKRYTKMPPKDRVELDIAYADSMKKVFLDFPDDADIGTLYAESLMNLHPWDLWDKSGKVRPWTPEIINTLEKVITFSPRHPGAHHFYIHAVEMSFEPHKGLHSAQLFDDGLVSGAGHLLHMPSHIYIRTGDYHKGSLSNIKAIAVDSGYATACNAQGVYPLAYFPHNYHFLAATATLEGNSKWAIYASNKVSTHSNQQLMKEPGWGTIQHYFCIPYYVNVKFGKWEEILNKNNPDTTLHYPQAIRNYARGMAFVGLKDLKSAKSELMLLENYLKDESLKKITIWEINSVDVLVQIAYKVLMAEILASESDFSTSIKLLKEAVEMEDGLNYNEPPDWFFSIRHNLGSTQIAAGKYKDAVNTYEDDLKRLPQNGWAIHGLKLAYEKLKDIKKSKEMEHVLSSVWSTADVELYGSKVK
jgi:tetratricopeptide (TPR) repeat protein